MTRTLRTPKKQQETTAARQARFLKAYATAGTILGASALARVGRRTHYDWLERDEAYQTVFAEAREDAADHLEQEAIRRAHDGVRKPVYQGGKRVGWIQEYSDVLLIFLLKGLRPEKYRERFEHTGAGKGGAMLVSYDASMNPPTRTRQARGGNALAPSACELADDVSQHDDSPSRARGKVPFCVRPPAALSREMSPAEADHPHSTVEP